jgi:hypothetical protein
VRKAKKRSKGWEIDLLRLRKLSEHGTIEVEFIAGENGLMPSIVSENLNLKIGNSMQIGGPPQKWHLKSPLQEGEKATLILRWRRFPLTREASEITSARRRKGNPYSPLAPFPPHA